MHLPTSTKPDTTWLPTLSLLFAASAWGLIWYPLRLLEQAGLSGVWTTLVMFAAALLPGTYLVWGRLHELRSRPLLLLLLALANGWCNLAFILAVLDGAVVRVMLLFYLSPVWATLLGHFLLGEHMTRLARINLLLAMSGALIMLWEPAIGAPWPQDSADWLALSSGLGFALSNVMVRKLDTISVRSKTWVSWLGGVLVTGTGILLGAGGEATPVLLPWLGALLLGMVAILSMTLAVQYGVTHMPVHRSAVILLFELVVGTISSQLLTQEVMQPLEWFGGALIMGAAYLTGRDQWLASRAKERSTAC